ncbi:alpha/beta hydrolase [Methylophaga sp. SB9B]|uniref:RBBP9/YdeN family alpha/beta hydrolase n=1 Tax=Methylophaga sp. SB9B TaxID=2570356 RepID=UPI0010A8342B|nr:alpha/beta hydrolase [Methylophaga sp. SB9B]THK42094.1 alpha/beta hydrolase [Methylophaga sp. SB9B]
MKTKILTVPGFHGSDENHWQTWLEQQFSDSERLTGVNWESPRIYPWAEALEKQLDTMPGQAILVAHSFGCLVSALIASWRPEKVAGVILVAPAAPQRFSLYGAIKESQKNLQTIAGTLPDQHLNMLGVLVASKNDPWMSVVQADQLSRDWGLAFYNAGNAGHINSKSGYGAWPLIKDFVSAMLEAIEPLPGDEVFQLSSWNSSRKRLLPKTYSTIGLTTHQSAFLQYA